MNSVERRGEGAKRRRGEEAKMRDVILHGDCLKVLRSMPEKSVNMVMCSPPYWALRDYGDGVESIWDGDADCEHEWEHKEKIIEKFSGKGAGWLIGHEKGKKEAKVITRKENPENWKKKDVGTDFCSKCGAWKGQLGLEPSFELYIKHLCDIFDEIKRVLRDDGTCWVNLGDTYAAGGGKAVEQSSKRQAAIETESYPNFAPNAKLRSAMPKCLLQIPARFSIEMVNRGWILRNTLIWHKPNCMPSSAKDRFTVDFEYLFFFSKNKKYYFEQQFEEYTQSLDRWGGTNLKANGVSDWCDATGQNAYRDRNMRPNHLGRNKRTTWKICPQPYPEAHFATYPEELCVTPIMAGCPEFVCKKCGQAREKIVEGTSGQAFNVRVRDVQKNRIKHTDRKASKEEVLNYQEGVSHIGNGKRFTGYTDCGCGAGFEPGIVLDPFMGSGTTGLVALKLGRSYIGIEQSGEYIELAKRRLDKEQNQVKLKI